MQQLPRFQQIKTHIEEKIASKTWLPGHKVPTEAELCEQFGVSRMTVNKAIRDLVNQGLLERTPRIGTFVCHRKAESPLMDIRNIADEVRSRGQEYRSEIVVLEAKLASEDVAVRLGVMTHAEIFYSEIVHFADDLPIQVELRWVNPKFAPNYLSQDYSGITPHQYLSESCPLSAVEHTVEAIIAPGAIASLLKMDKSSPCLLLHRRTWSQDNLISAALLYHPAVATNSVR